MFSLRFGVTVLTNSSAMFTTVALVTFITVFHSLNLTKRSILWEHNSVIRLIKIIIILIDYRKLLQGDNAQTKIRTIGPSSTQLLYVLSKSSINGRVGNKTQVDCSRLKVKQFTENLRSNKGMSKILLFAILSISCQIRENSLIWSSFIWSHDCIVG